MAGGRSGPPLWSGLVVMILVPILVIGYGIYDLVSKIDLDPSRVRSGHATTLTKGSGYAIAAPVHQRHGRCTVTGPDGKRVPIDGSRKGRTITLHKHTYASVGSFEAGQQGRYRIACAGLAGKPLVLIAVEDGAAGLATGFGWAAIIAGAAFVIGLLMVIFRRRQPPRPPETMITDWQL